MESLRKERYACSLRLDWMLKLMSSSCQFHRNPRLPQGLYRLLVVSIKMLNYYIQLSRKSSRLDLQV